MWLNKRQVYAVTTLSLTLITVTPSPEENMWWAFLFVMVFSEYNKVDPPAMVRAVVCRDVCHVGERGRGWTLKGKNESVFVYSASFYTCLSLQKLLNRVMEMITDNHSKPVEISLHRSKNIIRVKHWTIYDAHTHTHEHAHAYVHTHTRMCTRTRTHAHAHTHTHTHTHKECHVVIVTFQVCTQSFLPCPSRITVNNFFSHFCPHILMKA